MTIVQRDNMVMKEIQNTWHIISTAKASSKQSIQRICSLRSCLSFILTQMACSTAPFFPSLQALLKQPSNFADVDAQLVYLRPMLRQTHFINGCMAIPGPALEKPFLPNALPQVGKPLFGTSQQSILNFPGLLQCTGPLALPASVSALFQRIVSRNFFGTGQVVKKELQMPVQAQLTKPETSEAPISDSASPDLRLGIPRRGGSYIFRAQVARSTTSPPNGSRRLRHTGRLSQAGCQISKNQTTKTIRARHKRTRLSPRYPGSSPKGTFMTPQAPRKCL